ncbi:trans-acting enoyl reductase family protein [Melioribacteraceae bacterium 4301-Me]|uniref:saccharopine dehydrogenase family protein n=1 Tax=Pyranulibacter aquaticus TaxID=3163344 RepID=UPI00359623C3
MDSGKNGLLIYGANGYTANLIINELLKRNIKPVLSGRNESAIKKLIEKYNLPLSYKIFNLDDEDKTVENIKEFHTLLNCAGPFKYTAEKLIEACLKANVNYLDITGEIEVLQTAFEKDKQAKESKIVILPAIGFDVVPTDCLSKKISLTMPNAEHLMLGLLNKHGKISRGTLLTTIEVLSGNGKIRKDGILTDSPIGEYKIKVVNEKIKFYGISIPWGDVYTSYYSTEIPNISFYLALPRILYYSTWIIPAIKKIISNKYIKKVINSVIRKSTYGPSEKSRRKTRTIIWGRAIDESGKVYEEAYRVLEAYELTAISAAEAVVKVLSSNIEPGVYTPSNALGHTFMNQFILERII